MATVTKLVMFSDLFSSSVSFSCGFVCCNFTSSSVEDLASNPVFSDVLMLTLTLALLE